jgi:hypothetical protein
MMPSGGSMPGESALKARPSRIDREADHDEIDGGGDKKDGDKYQKRHRRKRQIEQPVAHAVRVWITADWFARAPRAFSRRPCAGCGKCHSGLVRLRARISSRSRMA